MKSTTIHRRIQCVLAIMLIMMATLVQFHHHDCQGNVYWHITLQSDIELSSNGCSIEHCHIDNLANDCHHNQEQHKTCPMHIGAAMVSDHVFATPPIMEIDNDMIIVDFELPQCDIITMHHCLWQYGCKDYKSPLIASVRFRGPPTYNA